MLAFLAFAAGLVSCLSPCVLPIVPGYMGAVVGIHTRSPWSAAATGIAFSTGLMLVFLVLFLAIGVIAAPVRGALPALAAVVLAVTALWTAHVLPLPGLEHTFHPLRPVTACGGVARGFVLGAAFATGWTPCIGLTLGAILTTAASEGVTPATLGAVAAYAAGLGLPFAIFGVAAHRGLGALRVLTRHRRAIDLLSAGVLLAMAAVLVTGSLPRMASALTPLLERVSSLVHL